MLARETPDGLMLINGHARVEVSPDTEIPVLVLDVTEQEANLILATLDPLAAMAAGCRKTRHPATRPTAAVRGAGVDAG